MMHSTKLEQTPKLSWRFQAFGTQWEIVSGRDIDDALRVTITSAFEAFETVYSRFRTDSLISSVAKKAGTYHFPESATTLFDFYDELFEISEEKVTPMVGATLVSAGYDQAYSLRPDATIRATPGYKEILQRDGAKLTVTAPTLIDIGAIGKGYFVDYLVDVMTRHGHTDFVVDGSGDLRVVGDRVETIGLEDPNDPTKVLGVVDVSGKALCASAINRRAWGDWHHVIDPTTSTPVRDIIATWVIADSAMIADGLATALFFTSPQKLKTRYTYEYARMHADGGIEYSDYFAKGVFS